MKNKMKLIVGIIIVALASIIAFVVYSFNNNNYEPERPSSVPKEAFWRGAPDEGFWFEIINVDSISKTVRLKIYTDTKGEVALDADFREKSNCKTIPFSKENVISNLTALAYRDGKHDEIWMANRCDLEMIKPAYGGSFKEGNN
jgi:hypothetical protein